MAATPNTTGLLLVLGPPAQGTVALVVVELLDERIPQCVCRTWSLKGLHQTTEAQPPRHLSVCHPLRLPPPEVQLGREHSWVPTLPPASSEHSCEHTFTRESPLAQNPCPCSRPNWSCGRKRRTRKCCGSSRVNLKVGQALKAKPAPAPPCDKTSVLARSSILGKTNSNIHQHSILDAASCCQPRCRSQGSNCSGSSTSGRAPTASLTS